ASGFKKENIFYLPAEDNWWGLEYGPCGPDSEMFYVKDDVPPCGPDCKPGCHCGKYTEIGNDVFMQYEKHQDGHLTPLKQQNVDTGWGLERILAFLNGLDDVYKIDLHAPAISYIEQASGIKYDSDEKMTRSMRILADHTRTAVMLIGDEKKLLPSNAGAGYVLRRLIRRAVRHARALGLKEENILKVAETYIGVYAESYPLLVQNKAFILSELGKEIERFEATLENGLKEFKKILDEKLAAKSGQIDGKSAFYLYDTFGFPIELTVELAEEEGLTVDEAGFATAMEEQKAKARENQNFSAKLSVNSGLFDDLGAAATEFVGYEVIKNQTSVTALASEDTRKDSLEEGEEGTVIVPVTSFYATMGGQKGDFGVIRSERAIFEVMDTVKLSGGLVGHVGKVVSGKLSVGDIVTMEVDAANRASTCKNHSATHLLQAALQEVLGDQVHQQGSYQDGSRTRFDFSFSRAMTEEEIAKVEAIVNEKIAEDLPVVTKVMNIEEAKKSGAMALFGEKYGETVRVVSMGDFSKEFCGGTHVKRTGDIASFKILSESGIAAGVRRIEGLTSANVLEYYRTIEENLKAAAAAAKSTTANLVEKIQHLQAEVKALSSENESLKSKLAQSSLGDVMNQVKEVKGTKLLATSVAGVDVNGLRDLGDQLKTKLGEGVVVLLSEQDGKVNMIAMATDGAVKAGAHAGNLIKGIAALVGGGGGGRPNMAQAGGKNPAGIPAAIQEAAKVLESQLQ
ncbi:MAG: alanine--tRNA ligase, partial [Lachnospiraceae bacterium]|nr:alanine--tRNA ligase [Lachnospiraceae bacterium]